jgi:signal transduction histidine kinase/ActR/RegA family two-component response regulator
MVTPFQRTATKRGYLAAGLAIAAAVGLHYALYGILADQAPFFPFLLAVIVTAWYGGLKPGLAATVLGAACGVYYSLPPAHPPMIEQLSRPTVVGLFLVLGLTASWLCGSLHAAHRRIEEADRRKNDFLATLAHELRNPLAPIRTALEIMRRADDNPALMGQIRKIMERQLGHLIRLIDDLLDVSRITRGKLQLRKECVSLAMVIQSAVEAARPFIDVQEHDLSISLPKEAIYLDADPTRLAQIFANLLNNAAKFTAPRGQIWLGAERQGGEVVLSVRDSGIGIAAEQLPRLFEMFEQAAPALQRTHGGLGIGLALVRGLVMLHGGTVEARSAGPGQGSEFLLRLPSIDPPPAAPPAAAGAAQPSGSKCRVLIVDDLPDSVDSMGTMLELLGHEVATAHDGREAIEAAARFHPDVVLLDIGLPNMNGYEAAQQIRANARGKRMMLVALTGWGQEEDKRRALAAGFDLHVTKPVEPATLEQLLAKVRIPAVAEFAKQMVGDRQ